MVSSFPLPVVLMWLVIVRRELPPIVTPSLNHRILGTGLPVALHVKVRLRNSSTGPADPLLTTLGSLFKLISVIFALSRKKG